MGGFENYFNTPSVMNESMATFLAMTMLGGGLVAIAFGIVLYVLQALGLYTIAKRRCIRKPWLAWLPVGDMWILGSISDQYQYVKKGRVSNRRKILMGLNIPLLILMIPYYALTYLKTYAEIMALFNVVVTMPINVEVAYAALNTTVQILSIVHLVFYCIAYYDLFVSCKPDNAVLFLVLGILFSFLLPFFVFACRKNDLGMPPRKEPQSAPILPMQMPEDAPEEEALFDDSEVTDADFADEE